MERFAERNKEIVRRYTTGTSVETIANDIGISRQRVHQILKSKGIISHRKSQLDLVREFSTKKHPKTILEIKNRFGMSYHGVKKLIERLDLPYKKKETLVGLLRALDTEDMTFEEMYEECKHLTTGEHAFRQALSHYGVKYKTYCKE